MAASTSDVEASKFGDIISIPPIAERILLHLTIGDLKNYERVCKLWQKFAAQSKKKRRQIQYLYWEKSQKRRLDKSKVTGCSECLKNEFNLMYSEPKYTFIFGTKSLTRQGSQLKNPENIAGYIQAQLPNTTLIGVLASGIVGTDRQNVCHENEKTVSFSAFCIPDLPYLEIYPFVIDESKYKDNCIFGDEELQEITKIPRDSKVKALVLLRNLIDYDSHGAGNVAETLYSKYGPQLAVGGGFVDKLILSSGITDMSMDKQPRTIGIAFAGEEVQAASIILGSDVMTPEDAEATIAKLKLRKMPEERSFAFMFACCGRGVSHYDLIDVETTAFRKVFPNTPLFGFFGNGEIGIDSYNLPLDKIGKRDQFQIFYGFTTVIVFVSLG